MLYKKSLEQTLRQDKLLEPRVGIQTDKQFIVETECF
jgi:hypothetical protein